MCEKGDTVTMVLPARPLSDPFGKHLNYSIDRCIAPLVAALNRGGITTVASCCGHGEAPGSIALDGGRWLVIAENQAAFEHLTQRDSAPPRDATREPSNSVVSGSDAVPRSPETRDV